MDLFGRPLVRKFLPQRSPRTQRKNLSVNSVPSVAKARPKRRAPARSEERRVGKKGMCCRGAHCFVPSWLRVRHPGQPKRVCQGGSHTKARSHEGFREESASGSESGSESIPELASPWTFSEDLW